MRLADRFDAFLLDLDGVVWRGQKVISGAPETVARLRQEGKRVVFVTNNAAGSPRDYAVKLMRMLIPTEPADIVTSGHVVVEHLYELGLRSGDRVHLCAAQGLALVLKGAGFVPTRETREIGAVVVAWNPRLTFDDLRQAADAVRTGVPFVAANADPTYPSEEGLLPGSGAILAAVETAAGRTATVVGKPRPELVRLALERAGADPARALFCGDRPETDVAGARAAGVPVALVLTGVTSERDLGGLTERPDWIIRDITELLAAQATEVGTLSAAPVVERATDGVAAEGEGQDEGESGDEPSDVSEVRDPTLLDLP